MMKNNPLEELFKDRRPTYEPTKGNSVKNNLIIALSLSLLISFLVSVLFNSSIHANNKRDEH